MQVKDIEEGARMGKVVEKVKLTEPEKSVEVDVVIDTGATMLVEPESAQPLIGQIILEEVLIATSPNSRYAARLRPSKPLRVSHTRRTLASRSILIDIEQEKINGESK